MAVHIVLYNQSRLKVSTELLREVKILYSNLWVGTGNNKGGGRNPNIRSLVAEKIGISQTKIQKLLYIYQNQPELIKYIDDDRMTIHSAWLETRRQMNTISL